MLAMAIGSLATAAHSQRRDDLVPDVGSRFWIQPAPIPAPSEGRIPVSLRLVDSIWTEGGPASPTATEVRFDFDAHFGLDLSGEPRCPTGIHFDIRTPESPCEKMKFATGKMRFVVAFPDSEPLTVTGRVIAFKTNERTMRIRAYFPAPITGEVLIPVRLARAPGGSIYGLTATASIPRVAGGYGSLVYLGLRFRKGLFSAACPEGRLQSRGTTTFTDGSKVSIGALTTC
ncbi:MAG TPA: hypothetical protein VF125_03190 [Solirubrobacterales bacterium]